MGPAHYDFDDMETLPRVPRKKKLTRNQEIEILKHSSSTFLTPTVNRIAQRFFAGSLEVSAPLMDDMLDEASVNLRDYKAHPLNPRKMVLSNRLMKGKDVFGNVTIDGVAYEVRSQFLYEKLILTIFYSVRPGTLLWSNLILIINQAENPVPPNPLTNMAIDGGKFHFYLTFKLR